MNNFKKFNRISSEYKTAIQIQIIREIKQLNFLIVNASKIISANINNIIF